MECDLNPELWWQTPEDIVETILQTYFRTLCAPCLVEFRLLSKAWNSAILSSKVLYPRSSECLKTPDIPKGIFCTYDKQLVLCLEPKRSLWVERSLHYLHNPERDHQKGARGTKNILDSLQFITTDGGLLCFSTSLYGLILVCNLLTEHWKEVWLPAEFGRKDYHPDSEILQERSAKDVRENMDNLLVGLIVARDTGHYKLIVTNMHDCNGQRTTIEYNSSSKSWSKIAAVFPLPMLPGSPVSQEFVQPIKSRPDGSLTYNGCIYCLLKYELVYTVGIVWQLLRFNGEDDCWSIIPLPRQGSRMHPWTWWQVSFQLFEYRGRLVLMESISWRWFEFHMLEDSTSTNLSDVWKPVLRNLTREMGTFIRFFNPKDRTGALSTCFRCVGKGEHLYFVEENFDHRPKNLKVLLCDLSSASDTEGESLKFWESVSEDYFNQSRCWIFQPSLTPAS